MIINLGHTLAVIRVDVVSTTHANVVGNIIYDTVIIYSNVVRVRLCLSVCVFSCARACVCVCVCVCVRVLIMFVFATG